MTRYKVARQKKETRGRLPVVEVLAGVFFVLLPFVVSVQGLEKFRVPKDVFAVVWILLLGVTAVATLPIRLRLQVKSWELILLFFVAYVALHALWVGPLPEALDGLLYLLLFALLFWILKQVASFSFQKSLWLWIGGALGVNAVLTVLQYYGQFPLMIRPTGEAVAGRINPAGLIGEVNSGGFLFGLVIILLLHGLFAEKRFWIRLLGAAFLVLNLTGLLFSRTLTSLLALGVCLGLWFILHHWWVARHENRLGRALVGLWVFLVLGLVASGGVAVQSGMLERIQGVWEEVQEGDWNEVTAGRYPVYLLTWEMIQEDPWWGRGLNTFKKDFFFFRAQTEFGQQLALIDQPGAFREAHNEYLQVWEELGVVGFGLFLLLLFGPIVRGVRDLIAEEVPEKAYGIGLLCIAGVFVAVSSLTFFPFHLSVTAAYVVLVYAGLRHVQNPPQWEEEELAAGGMKPFWRSKKILAAGATLVAVLVAVPAIQWWRANSEAGIASVLVEESLSPQFSLQQQRILADEALSRLEKAERLAPRLYEIYNLKGSALMVLGRYGEAVRSFENAAHHLPSPEFFTNLAAAHLEQKEYAEARNYLELALRYNPQYQRAHRAREFLETASQ